MKTKWTESERKVIVSDTKFIFRTNFAGDPSKDETYHSSTRKGNIIIPQEIADILAEEGFNVKMTTPKEGEEQGFIPKYFVSAILNFDSEVAKERPPKVYLVSGDNPPRELDADSVRAIDNVYVTNVNVTLEKAHSNKYNKNLLYIRTMYVEQDVDDDPFASRYSTKQQPAGPEDPYVGMDDDMPFE